MGGGGNIVKNDGGGDVMVVFTNYRNKLFSTKPIFRFGAGHFVFIFVVLSSFTAQFACFWHNDKIGCAFAHSHSPHFRRSISGRAVFKQNILSKFSFTNCFCCAFLFEFFS